MTLDYLGHIATESDRFADVIARVPTDRPVPSCPEWTAADLWFHLGEVQWHWGRIVADRLTDRAEVRQLGKPDRPDDLAGFFAEASGLLRTALADIPPETPVWTWADDRTAGFVRRRQAHEAVIHRVDAELVAEDRTPLDPALAADGVAEVLTVMYGEPPTDWGEYRPAEDRVLELVATDTGDRWTVTLGRFTGTSPSGRDYDRYMFTPADPGWPATARMSGTAGDLDCALWQRAPLEDVTLDGDQATLDALSELMREGIN